MEQRAKVVVGANRIHEDERQPVLGEGLLVAAGRFALAAVEVQDAQGCQFVEYAAQLRVHALENPAATLHKLVHILKRSQRRAASRIDVEVPRPQGFQAQFAAALLGQLAGRGYDAALDSVMKSQAIRGCVVEAAVVLETVVAVIGTAGVPGDRSRKTSF